MIGDRMLDDTTRRSVADCIVDLLMSSMMVTTFANLYIMKAIKRHEDKLNVVLQTSSVMDKEVIEDDEEKIDFSGIEVSNRRNIKSMDLTTRMKNYSFQSSQNNCDQK